MNYNIPEIKFHKAKGRENSFNNISLGNNAAEI